MGAADTLHWRMTLSRQSRSGGSSSGSVEDTDSSTDDSYTALDLQVPRPCRRRYPELSSRRHHTTDDDDNDRRVCELLPSLSDLRPFTFAVVFVVQ